MRHSIKFLTALFVICYMTSTQAIQVSVHAASGQVAALGFTVNGQNHGGSGSSYSASDLPTGAYSFGMRTSLFGDDISCATPSGQQTVTLKSNANVVFDYNGKKCIMHISKTK